MKHIRLWLLAGLFPLLLAAQSVVISVTANPSGSTVVIDVPDLAGGTLIINTPSAGGAYDRLIESGGTRLIESGGTRVTEGAP